VVKSPGNTVNILVVINRLNEKLLLASSSEALLKKKEKIKIRKEGRQGRRQPPSQSLC
jgi:hypothetical protein